MSNSVEKEILESLQNFLVELEENRPIEVTRVEKVTTPDGQMHLTSKHLLQAKEEK